MANRSRTIQAVAGQLFSGWLRVAAGLALIACSESTGIASEPLNPGGQSTGVIEVTIVSTGQPIDFDPDGYSLKVDDAEERMIATNGKVVTAALSPGKHKLSLAGIAPNCTLDGGSEQTVRVIAGRKTFAGFSASCVSNFGNVHLLVTTIGPIPASTRFSASLPGVAAIVVGINSSGSFEKVRAGSAALTLTDLPVNCEVDGPNPVSVTIAFKATTEVAFTVRCVTPGTLKLSGSMSGEDVPRGSAYAIEITRQGTSARTHVEVLADTTLSPLMPGTYSLNVLVTVPNCSPIIPNPRIVEIAAGAPTEVMVQIVCTRVAQLAFVVYENGGPAIYSEDELGGSLRRLIANGSAPAWSPDGKHIAFVDELDGHRTHVMDADGSHNIRLTSRFALNPTWSPDGSRIAFEALAGDNSDRRQIYVVNADGSGEKPLIVTTTSDFEPDWSPDGLQLVLTRMGGGIDGLWVMNVDGTGGRRLTERGGDRNSSWSPDGKTIAFSRGDSYSSEIFLIDLHDNLTQLTHAGMSATEPVWSLEGRRVAYSAYTRICAADFYYPDAPCDSGLFSSTLDGVAIRIPTPASAYQPAWRR